MLPTHIKTSKGGVAADEGVVLLLCPPETIQMRYTVHTETLKNLEMSHIVSSLAVASLHKKQFERWLTGSVWCVLTHNRCNGSLILVRT